MSNLICMDVYLTLLDSLLVFYRWNLKLVGFWRDVDTFAEFLYV